MSDLRERLGHFIENERVHASIEEPGIKDALLRQLGWLELVVQEKAVPVPLAVTTFHCQDCSRDLCWRCKGEPCRCLNPYHSGGAA